MLLEVRHLSVRYGRNLAVNDVSLTVDRGEIVTVLGANGAGKSSLLKTICGLQKPADGQILFDGEDVTQLSVPRRVRRGIVLVPEGRQVLVSLTVHENLLMGASFRDAEEIREDCAAIYKRFPNLHERRDMLGSVLSGGEQQMLAISRAILARPKLMMLDEPSLGLSPILVGQIFKLIEDLHAEGLTILLVEQNARMALRTAHRGYVLELGSVVMHGGVEKLKAGEKMEGAYLGG